MSKLRLGPIGDDKPVKISVDLPAAIHRDLLSYAEAHAAENGLGTPLPIERLVGPMLAKFMTGDRGFRRKL